jgi:hypothetical protein
MRHTGKLSLSPERASMSFLNYCFARPPHLNIRVPNIVMQRAGIAAGYDDNYLAFCARVDLQHSATKAQPAEEMNSPDENCLVPPISCAAPVQADEKMAENDGLLVTGEEELCNEDHVEHVVRPFHAFTSAELDCLRILIEEESWARRNLPSEMNVTNQEAQLRALFTKHLPLMPLRSAKTSTKAVSASFRTPTLVHSTGTTPSPATLEDRTSSESTSTSSAKPNETSELRKRAKRDSFEAVEDAFLKHMVQEAIKAGKFDKFKSWMQDWDLTFPKNPKSHLQLRNRYKHLLRKEQNKATLEGEGAVLFGDGEDEARAES